MTLRSDRKKCLQINVNVHNSKYVKHWIYLFEVKLTIKPLKWLLEV